MVEQAGKQLTIGSGRENEQLLQLAQAVREFDPDVVLTAGGDSYLFPYLIHRAAVNGVLDRFVLWLRRI